MKDLMELDKLKSWQKVLNNFNRNFVSDKIIGICSLINKMMEKDLLSNDEVIFLRKEINIDLYKKQEDDDSILDVAWLFPMFNYELRLKYIESKIKKYSNNENN